MKNLCAILFTVALSSSVAAQNKTDISLAWKGSGQQESQIESPTGNLYTKLEHHGPAIENEWVGFRMYFDFKTSIDVYSKTRPGLE
jgi:hypothetical protein